MPQEKHICNKCGQEFQEWAYRKYKRCPNCRKQPPITQETLEKLYIEQKLSCIEVARRTTTTPRTIKYWLRRYGIPRRTAIETRFPDRPKPDRESLYNYYWIQWLSYQEIAVIYQVDPTAIPYWLRKFNIPRRSNWDTRRRGKTVEKPTKEELEELYQVQGYSTADIGMIYGISAHCISDCLKTLGIQKRLPGYTRIRYKATDGHEMRSNLEVKVDDWLFAHDIPHIYEPILPFGGKADFLVGNIYIEIWGINHNDKYTNRKAAKKKLYKEYGLKLIELYPKDIFRHLDEKLTIGLSSNLGHDIAK